MKKKKNRALINEDFGYFIRKYSEMISYSLLVIISHQPNL